MQPMPDSPRARFTGKVAVVIGGNSGIGLASAAAFAREGARVVISGRNDETLRKAVEHIGHETVGVRADISSLQQIHSLMDEVKQRFGRIDVLFVNAGIGAFLPIEKVTERDWDELMAIMLKGVFFWVLKALTLFENGA